MSAAGLDSEVSVKPTQLGLDIDAAAAYANLERLARAATQANCFLWIDMEGSAYTDGDDRPLSPAAGRSPSTPESRSRPTSTSTVDDIAGLGFRMKPAIRLVKGAYAEPGTIASSAPNETSTRTTLALCAFMLPQVKQSKLRLCPRDSRRGFDRAHHAFRARRHGLEQRQLEVAMLYGIRTDQQLRPARDGHMVKDLISYGDAWYAWHVRRLAERARPTSCSRRARFSARPPTPAPGRCRTRSSRSNRPS